MTILEKLEQRKTELENLIMESNADKFTLGKSLAFTVELIKKLKGEK